MNEEIKINLDELEKNIEEQTAEEIRNENQETIEEAAPVDDIPRNEDGTINIDLIATGKTEKGYYIIDDDIFDKYYKELPAGTVNKSGTWRAANNGKIKIFGGNPEEDKAIHIKGAATSNAAQAQRRTFRDTINYMLKQKANKRTIEDLGLTDGATNLDAVIAAAFMQANKGNVKAMDFLRDTVGEKPSDRLEATVENLTPEDREMLENIKNRLGKND